MINSAESGWYSNNNDDDQSKDKDRNILYNKHNSTILENFTQNIEKLSSKVENLVQESDQNMSHYESLVDNWQNNLQTILENISNLSQQEKEILDQKTGEYSLKWENCYDDNYGTKFTIATHHLPITISSSECIETLPVERFKLILAELETLFNRVDKITNKFSRLNSQMIRKYLRFISELSMTNDLELTNINLFENKIYNDPNEYSGRDLVENILFIKDVRPSVFDERKDKVYKFWESNFSAPFADYLKLNVNPTKSKDLANFFNLRKRINIEKDSQKLEFNLNILNKSNEYFKHPTMWSGGKEFLNELNKVYSHSDDLNIMINFNELYKNELGLFKNTSEYYNNIHIHDKSWVIQGTWDCNEDLANLNVDAHSQLAMEINSSNKAVKSLRNRGKGGRAKRKLNEEDDSDDDDDDEDDDDEDELDKESNNKAKRKKICNYAKELNKLFGQEFIEAEENLTFWDRMLRPMSRLIIGSNKLNIGSVFNNLKDFDFKDGDEFLSQIENFQTFWAIIDEFMDESCKSEISDLLGIFFKDLRKMVFITHFFESNQDAPKMSILNIFENLNSQIFFPWNFTFRDAALLLILTKENTKKSSKYDNSETIQLFRSSLTMLLSSKLISPQYFMIAMWIYGQFFNYLKKDSDYNEGNLSFAQYEDFLISSSGEMKWSELENVTEKQINTQVLNYLNEVISSEVKQFSSIISIYLLSKIFDFIFYSLTFHPDTNLSKEYSWEYLQERRIMGHVELVSRLELRDHLDFFKRVIDDFQSCLSITLATSCVENNFYIQCDTAMLNLANLVSNRSTLRELFNSSCVDAHRYVTLIVYAIYKYKNLRNGNDVHGLMLDSHVDSILGKAMGNSLMDSSFLDDIGKGGCHAAMLDKFSDWYGVLINVDRKDITTDSLFKYLMKSMIDQDDQYKNDDIFLGDNDYIIVFNSEDDGNGIYNSACSILNTYFGDCQDCYQLNKIAPRYIKYDENSNLNLYDNDLKFDKNYAVIDIEANKKKYSDRQCDMFRLNNNSLPMLLPELENLTRKNKVFVSDRIYPNKPHDEIPLVNVLTADNRIFTFNSQIKNMKEYIEVYDWLNKKMSNNWVIVKKEVKRASTNRGVNLDNYSGNWKLVDFFNKFTFHAISLNDPRLKKVQIFYIKPMNFLFMIPDLKLVYFYNTSIKTAKSGRAFGGMGGSDEEMQELRQNKIDKLSESLNQMSSNYLNKGLYIEPVSDDIRKEKTYQFSTKKLNFARIDNDVKDKLMSSKCGEDQIEDILKEYQNLQSSFDAIDPSLKSSNEGIFLLNKFKVTLDSFTEFFDLLKDQASQFTVSCETMYDEIYSNLKVDLLHNLALKHATYENNFQNYYLFSTSGTDQNLQKSSILPKILIGEHGYLTMSVEELIKELQDNNSPLFKYFNTFKLDFFKHYLILILSKASQRHTAGALNLSICYSYKPTKTGRKFFLVILIIYLCYVAESQTQNFSV